MINKENVENIVPHDYKTRGSYSPAKKIDLGGYYLIFVSGVQPPTDNNYVVLTDNIEEQTELVFEEINNLLNLAGATIDDVVKAQIFLTNMNDFDKVSTIRGKWFKNSNPVSTLLEVNAMTRKGSKIEIEVTAIIKK